VCVKEYINACQQQRGQNKGFHALGAALYKGSNRPEYPIKGNKNEQPEYYIVK
jgi:hypothetical protein